MYEYQAKVVRVVDGDTVVLDIDRGMSDWAHDQHIRLWGIDAPDNEHPVEKRAATAHLMKLLPVGTMIRIKTIKDKKEKWGRYLGILEPMRPDLATNEYDMSYNQIMVRDGHAVNWDGLGKRPGVA